MIRIVNKFTLSYRSIGFCRQTSFFTIRWILIVFPLVSLHAVAQNVVSGTLLSIPSRTAPAEARVTFTNTATSEKYSQFTNDGNYSISVPSGTYQCKYEKVGDYLTIDTLLINSSQTMNLKLIEDTPLQSSLYLSAGKSLLFLFKSLTSTNDWRHSVGWGYLHRANSAQPRLYARNYSASDPLSMPQVLRPYLDQAITEISSKTVVSYNEQQTYSNKGISISYPTDANMPLKGMLGWTLAGLDSAAIYINRTRVPNRGEEKITFMTELLRAMLVQSNGADPLYIITLPKNWTAS